MNEFEPHTDRIEQLLNDATPASDVSFYEQLEAHLLQRLQKPTIPIQGHSPRRWFWRAIFPTQYRMAAAVMMTIAVTLAVFTAFPSLAQSLNQFFKRDTSDVKVQQAEVMVGEDNFDFFRGSPFPTGEAELFSLEEAQARVSYSITVPQTDGIFLSRLALNEDTETVIQIYTVPSIRGLNGSFFLTFEQTPANLYEPPSIGASAVVEEVAIGETTGAYVVGTYETQSQLSEVVSMPSGVVQDDNFLPYGSVVRIDYQSVWVNNPQWQQLAWQDGNKVYRVTANWANGLLNIRAFAEGVLHNTMIDAGQLIGMPQGIPDEWQAWVENVTFYDDYQSVVYEYRDDEVFVFISEGSANVPIFDRPEAAPDTHEMLSIGGHTGDYEAGLWEPRLLTLGSMPPFSRMTPEMFAEPIPYQWVRWQANGLTREVAVFNASYAPDELADIADHLVFTSPDYAARRSQSSPARADLRPVWRYAEASAESYSQFDVYVPRHIRFIPWPYNPYNTLYDYRMGVVWQPYGIYDPSQFYSTPVIPEDLEPPVLLIFQRPLKQQEQGLLSGCAWPESSTREALQLADGTPVLYTTGTWEAGSEPFIPLERLCIEGQHFQIIRWRQDGMAFEIMAIDANDITPAHLLTIAGSMERSR
ncbi:MAG: hypothetical protein H6673_10730 [Anaerolineales bacterium]|nr:hypothetical protein [Anaerolineales bacterium]